MAIAALFTFVTWVVAMREYPKSSIRTIIKVIITNTLYRFQCAKIIIFR